MRAGTQHVTCQVGREDHPGVRGRFGSGERTFETSTCQVRSVALWWCEDSDAGVFSLACTVPAEVPRTSGQSQDVCCGGTAGAPTIRV